MDILERIDKLKKERDAVIFAHYYAPAEVQDVADYVGDSFYLSRVAVGLKEQTVVFCGVSFMGESAKLLCPGKTVLMPDPVADCPMAHMADPETVKKMRETYSDLAVVCYINSTAELKACSDVCVTSANAVKVVKALPQRNIFFIPDKNLAHYVATLVPEKNFVFNEGWCPVHEELSLEELRRLKAEHPDAEVLTHPECPHAVLRESDFVGSTSEILKHAAESSSEKFIICTEVGVAHALERDNPSKRFYFTDTVPVCRDMKLLTLEKIAHVLETGENAVSLPGNIIYDAAEPLSRMLDLASAK